MLSGSSLSSTGKSFQNYYESKILTQLSHLGMQERTVIKNQNKKRP